MHSDEDALVEYKKIPVASLFVPRDYQREFKQRWVDVRVDKFSVRRLGTLTVVAAGNGKYSVVDGQHRLALIRAADALGIDQAPTSVWCEIRQEKSRSDEADLFLGRNDSQAVHPIDKYRARVIADEPAANQIKDIMGKYGVRIGHQSGRETTNYGCVTSIEKVFSQGHLDAVIKIVEESWAQTFGKQARTQLTIEGVALFHDTYHQASSYSIERVIREFSQIEKFSALVAQAKNNALANNTKAKYQFALLLVPRYNRQLSYKNRLNISNLIETY